MARAIQSEKQKGDHPPGLAKGDAELAKGKLVHSTGVARLAEVGGVEQLDITTQNRQKKRK